MINESTVEPVTELQTTTQIHVARRVRQAMWTIWVALLALGAAVPVARAKLGEWHVYTVNRFDLDMEGTVPSWYSGALLLFAAGLCVLLSLRAHDRGDACWRDWRFLALAFSFLSMDEVGGVHEVFLGALGEYKVLWFHPWILPCLVGLPLLLWRFLGLLRSVGARTRTWLVVSGLIYITGVVVLDALAIHHRGNHGTDAAYWVLTVIEEGCEMLGLILLNSHLLSLVTVTTSDRTTGRRT